MICLGLLWCGKNSFFNVNVRILSSDLKLLIHIKCLLSSFFPFKCYECIMSIYLTKMSLLLLGTSFSITFWALFVSISSHKVYSFVLCIHSLSAITLFYELLVRNILSSSIITTVFNSCTVITFVRS